LCLRGGGDLESKGVYFEVVEMEKGD
jgi:hypothetical protein